MEDDGFSHLSPILAFDLAANSNPAQPFLDQPSMSRVWKPSGNQM